MSVSICVSCTELGVHSWVIIHYDILTDSSVKPTATLRNLASTQRCILGMSLTLSRSLLSLHSLGKRLCLLIPSSWYL